MAIRIAAFLPLMLLAIKCSACNCAGKLGLSDAEAVFTGEVIGIRNLIDSVGVYEIEFKVIKWIKGAQKADRCVVYENSLYQGCGFPFEMDGIYEVYTYRGLSGHLLTNGCSETRLIERHSWLYYWNRRDNDTSKRR